MSHSMRANVFGDTSQLGVSSNHALNAACAKSAIIAGSAGLAMIATIA